MLQKLHYSSTIQIHTKIRVQLHYSSTIQIHTKIQVQF